MGHRASDRVELPFFFAHPSGKMTRKIWPANSGPAIYGSLNVRAWPAHTFPFGAGELEQDFSAGRSSRRQGRRAAGRERLWPARVLTWRSGLAVTPRAHMKDSLHRFKREAPIYCFHITDVQKIWRPFGDRIPIDLDLW